MEKFTMVGIDFGTSSTVIAVKNYHEHSTDMQISYVKSDKDDGTTIIPTVAFLRKRDGKYFYGQEAQTEAQEWREPYISNFKMDLVSNDINKREEAKKLTKGFFKHLYHLFDEQKGILGIADDSVIKTIVSYPAKWPSEVISFMKEAAKEAGFGNAQSEVEGENEPCAAIRSALVCLPKETNGFIALDRPFNALLLDMGAGTSDITIAKCVINNDNHSSPGINVGIPGENGNYQILSYPPIDNPSLCGGREIDELLQNHIEHLLLQVLEACDTPITENTRKRLVNKVTKIKEIKAWKENNLSRALSLGNNGCNYGNLNAVIEDLELDDHRLSFVSREDFESISREHWKNLYRLIDGALENAKKQIDGFNGAQDIDVVFLTGGHSRWYKVKEFFTGENSTFLKIKDNQDRLIIQDNPQCTVASGLAYRGISKFNLRQSATNNIWIDITLLENTFSFHPVEQFAKLPAIVNVETEPISITRAIDTNDCIEATIECFYGEKKDSAKRFDRRTSIPLNSVVTRIIGRILKFITKDETYSIHMKCEIRVNEDGTGGITFKGKSNYNNSKDVLINL